MKTEKATDKSVFPVPKQEQENAQTAIIMVSEAIQITKLCQRKDAPTILLGCISMQERSGLKTSIFQVLKAS